MSPDTSFIADVSAGICKMKKPYAKREAEQRIASSLRYNVLLRKYRCEHCTAWHLTSLSRKRYVKRRNVHLREAGVELG